MTVTVPFRLKHRGSTAPTDAFFLPANTTAGLAAAVASLGDATVFRVAGGFVLIPSVGRAERLPGAVPLRRLHGDLFVPADADLHPALLPDEQAALTATHGLVFLAGGRALSFDPTKPLEPKAWLSIRTAPAAAWGPLPNPPPLAPRLTVIERPATAVEIESILNAGAPDGADPLAGPGEAGPVPESARPPSAGLAARAAAGMGYAAGLTLAGLGKLFGSPALARAGASLARKAIEAVPRVTEKLLGSQEAALRDVLRQLMEGNVEEALKRAPVAVADPDTPVSSVASDARLNSHDTRYSLRDLLGYGGGGGAAWAGGGDVWVKLAAQYRKLAETATAAGDYRRAAYLYGVLLRDLHAAAAVLLKGGLFRDVAILYRDRLKDNHAAARAFEQAGEYDEAVRLYEKAGQFVAAGDLLMKLGEADRAAEHYRTAAGRLVIAGKWVEGGDLLQTKLGDPAGVTIYTTGWLNGGAEVVPCGERLFDNCCSREDWRGLNALVSAAAERFAPPRTADADRFFNYARVAGAGKLPEEMWDDVVDRSRLLFADHIREMGAGPKIARRLFAGWSGPVERDAVFAAGFAHAPETPPAAEGARQLAAGKVTAVAVARGVRHVVVATTRAVVVWQPDEGRVLTVDSIPDGEAVVAVSATATGSWVFTLSLYYEDLVLRSYVATEDGFQARGVRKFAGGAVHPAGYSLHAPIVESDGPRVPMYVLGMAMLLSADVLVSHAVWNSTVTAATAFLRVPDGPSRTWEWDYNSLRRIDSNGETTRQWVPTWSPSAQMNGLLNALPLDYVTPAVGELEVVGLDAHGAVRWEGWRIPNGETPAAAVAGTLHWFEAVALVASRKIVVVDSQNAVRWYRVVASAVLEQIGSAYPVAHTSRAVAVVPRPAADEVVVVFADGSAVRVSEATVKATRATPHG